jgi:diaminohydroxyphosphoribosylaminopyrimidine deaminase/5-amino-6-(5-phosphoribosylamino)uracil reductase
MARALELARGVKGRTSPNPAVGAVLVRDGRIVGEGATQPSGGPHAEPVALAAAGDLARGATLYVTLEPCSHHGRTPPCADALVGAGIAAAHIATLDPNPQVAGSGRARLEAAGIPTHVGDGATAARALNEDFARWITTGRPLVIAKYAMSLDGRIATRTGNARWISGPVSLRETHAQRDRVDAILVGVGTVLADDPQLTTRIELPARPVQHPWRVVVDSQCRTPPAARVAGRAAAGRTTIYTTAAAPTERRAALEAAGVEVCVLPADGGRVSLGALLDEVGHRDVTSLLVEGGAAVHGALFDGSHVDQVTAFVAPVIIGGTAAPGAVGGEGVARLVDAARLMDIEVQRLGADTLISGYVRRVRWPEPTPPSTA